MRYSSINNHLGYEQSRRDDLEGLAYTLIYFMKGKLPWQGLQVKLRKEKCEALLKKKMEVSVTDVCSSLPDIVGNYLHYCRSLTFEETPNYSDIRKDFKSYIMEEKIDVNFSFDWVIMKKKEIEKLKCSLDCKGSGFKGTFEHGKSNHDKFDDLRLEETKEMLIVPRNRHIEAESSFNGTNVTEKDYSCDFNADEMDESNNSVNIRK